MRIILSSQGFTTDEIANEVSTIVGKPLSEINVCIINSAVYYLDKSKNKRWFINELNNIEKYIGGRIDFIDFYSQTIDEIKDRLLNCDLIYIVGGKQHIYSKIFNELKLTNFIKELAEKKVLFGSSAGAIVLGKQIISNEFWNKRYNCKLTDLEYQELGIVPFNVIPHYMREDHERWTKEFFKEVLSDNPFHVYALKDNQAIAYIDGNIKYIGNTPDIFGFNDKIITTNYLETERLILRKAVDSDLDYIYKNVWSDQSIAENMLWQVTKSLDEAKERLNRTINYQNNNYAYFICLKETNEAIGFVGIKEEYHNIYEETGICIASKYQNKGYGKEVLKEIKKLIFEKLNGERFIYSCFSTNEKSRKLCLSQNFKYLKSVPKIRDYDNKKYVSEMYYYDKEMYLKEIDNKKVEEYINANKKD